MDNKWQTVREIFDAALRCRPDERQEFVRRSCGDDQELLAEVESLLASLGSADDFLETPLIAQAAEVISHAPPTLECGMVLGHYEVVARIGEGGMGEVYLASDTRLNRKVAIKVLAAHIMEDRTRAGRFRQEALATSALNHPNIVTIHEIGRWRNRDFIVTEFIDGMTLRERMRKNRHSASEAVDIALQIASALAAAHSAGVVHRDIKPENIIIREDGLVKVVDFGIAKYSPEGKGKKALVETEAGEIIGTAAYMSPEQARGLETDAQTDIWSLGVIFYEMLAGRLPFPGATKSDRIAAILEREPEPVNITDEKTANGLRQVIGRSLAKDKKNRYRDVSEMAEALNALRETTGDHLPLILPARRKAAPRRAYQFAAVLLLLLGVGAAGLWAFLRSPQPAAAGQRAILVLPLKPINQANRDELYDIGIADSLIHRISSIKGFVVRPLSAIRKYAETEVDPVAAGREQQVDYVLASNYQIANGKIRVTSQLLNVETGHIDETYKSEKDAGNVFAMQDAVAMDLGRLLQSRFALSPGTQAASRGTDNEEAYRLYLQGMYLYDKRMLSDAHKAVEVLEQAVRLDPNYARAWAGLAHAHRYVMNLDVSVDRNEETKKLMEAVDRALGLDDTVSEAYSALCDNKLNYEYDFSSAETACRRAVELKPDSAVARNTYARFLMTRGRFDESIAEIQAAIDLEPTSYFHQIVYTVCLIEARRYEEALRQMDRLAELNPANAYNLYASNNSALMLQEDPVKAFERTMKYLRASGADEETVKRYMKAHQTADWPGVMREQARSYSQNPRNYDFLKGSFYAMIGDKDTAFEFLEKSFARREFWIAYLRVDPRLDSLRDDPRFTDLLNRVGLK